MVVPNEKPKVRYNWPDVLKLIGMFCVFAMHTNRFGEYSFLFRSITLSLFFIPAGVFAAKSLELSFRDFLKSSLLKIMVPYFVFSAIAAICNMILTGDSLLKLFVKVLYGGREHLPGAALWFLPALFCVRLYLYFGNRMAQKLASGRKGQLIWLSVFVFVVWGLGSMIRYFLFSVEIHGIQNIPLPWNADWAGVFLPIYFTGYLLSDWLKKFSLKECNIAWKIGWCACTVLVIAVIIKPELWKSVYRWTTICNPVLDCMIPEFLCAFPLLFGFFAIAKMLDRVNLFGKLGSDTLYYCGLEEPFKLCLAAVGWGMAKCFAQLSFEPDQWNFAVYVIVEMLLMVFVLTPISKKLFHKLF